MNEIKGKSTQDGAPTPNNPKLIKTIKCGDIEVPVEYLKQTAVTINGDDYIKLQLENKKQKEVIDKAIEYINDNLIISSILDGKKYYTINNYSFDYRELLDILKEVK